MPELREQGMAGEAATPRFFTLLTAAKILGAVHLFGGCNIRDSRPGRGAARPVGPDHDFAPLLRPRTPGRSQASRARYTW